MNGVPQRIQNVPPPSAEEMDQQAVLAYLDPLPRFEISQPGNILRIFERGGRFRPETGIPETEEDPGRPRTRLSNRGLGTANRTDPVFLGLQKTRLLDPTLNFLGTNDHAGDYRSSGCSGCHVIYANDRSPVHSGPYARFGNARYKFFAGPGDSEKLLRASDRAPVHALHSQQPVHRLPHPSRNQRHEQLSGLHVVGQRDRRRIDVSFPAEAPHCRRTGPRQHVESR